MAEFLMVFCNCADETQASRIGRAAVEAHLAACANICGAVESVYRWQGAIETTREVMLILKTTAEAFSSLDSLIRSLHSYDTPEILAIPVAAGSERYLSWVAASVAPEFSAPSPKVPGADAE